MYFYRGTLMKLNNNSKFDIDLKYGQVREKRVADLLGKEQVEIKTERNWWRKTGNIALEYAEKARAQVRNMHGFDDKSREILADAVNFLVERGL